MSKQRQQIKNGVAWLYKDNLPMFGGHAACYQISPPLPCIGGGAGKTEWLIVYSVDKNCRKEETVVYPSNQDCSVLRWEEIPGSYVLGLDHHKALAQLGYANIQKHIRYEDLKRERVEVYE